MRVCCISWNWLDRQTVVLRTTATKHYVRNMANTQENACMIEYTNAGSAEYLPGREQINTRCSWITEIIPDNDVELFGKSTKNIVSNFGDRCFSLDPPNRQSKWCVRFKKSTWFSPKLGARFRKGCTWNSRELTKNPMRQIVSDAWSIVRWNMWVARTYKLLV